jgi:bifunctional non-homologous end joining protein LigD
MSELLKKYRQMRDFGDTPEPSGGKPKRAKLPIFVIQKHHATQLHYDFRLEMEGVLKSWAVPKGPSYDPTVKRLAMMTEDHPYDYAGFEGVIPEGNYGAGNVIIWDNGMWQFIEPGDDPVKALNQGKLTFRLFGKKMFGEWALVKIRGRSPKGNEWLLLKHRDQYANADVDVTEVAPRSIISNLDVDEIGAENTWQSNRKASFGRRAPTLAARLAAEEKAKATKKPVSRSRRAPAERSPAASARTRSSRARSPRPARPTPRRRLR